MAQDINQDVTNGDIMAMLAGDLTPADIHARRAEKKRQKALGRRQREIELELEKFSTGKLLKMRPHGGREVVFLDGDGYRRGRGSDYYSVDATEAEYDEQRARDLAIYAVLARRPHLPNKMEGHARRQAAATAHHGPKKPGGKSFRRGPPKVSARRAEQEQRKREKWFDQKCKENPHMAGQRAFYLKHYGLFS